MSFHGREEGGMTGMRLRMMMRQDHPLPELPRDSKLFEREEDARKECIARNLTAMELGRPWGWTVFRIVAPREGFIVRAVWREGKQP